jgi:hypothetical protein
VIPFGGHSSPAAVVVVIAVVVVVGLEVAVMIGGVGIVVLGVAAVGTSLLTLSNTKITSTIKYTLPFFIFSSGIDRTY